MFEDENLEDERGQVFSSVPSIIVAANNHDTASGDSSIFNAIVDGTITGTAVGVGLGLGNLPGGLIGLGVGLLLSPGKTDFAKASLIATANTFYNSGVAIGNIVREDDVAYEEAQEWMSKYDDDLALYYAENKGLVDTVSFVGGSFIPGLGALGIYNKTTKALNAAKLGALGKNTSGATGLLRPLQQSHLLKAKEAITNQSILTNLRNKDFILSLGLGAGEQAIQAAIFETAVVVTMSQAPLLEGSDLSDLGEHILWATILGGAIGGSIEGLIAHGGLRKAITESEKELRPLDFIPQLGDKASPSERIVVLFDSKFALPESVASITENLQSKAKRIIKTKKSKVEDLAGIEMQKIAGGDAVLANYVSGTLKNKVTTKEVTHSVLGLDEISRFADESPALKRVSELRSKINLGKTLAPQEYNLLDKYLEASYKIFGDDAGKITFKSPTVISIQDTLKKRQTIKLNKNGVQAGNKSYKFNTNPWSVLDVSVHAAQARFLWSMQIAKLPENLLIDTFDLPLISRAYKDAALKTAPLKYRLKDLEGNIVNITKKEELLKALEDHGNAARMELLKRSEAGKEFLDRTKSITELGESLGIDVSKIAKAELDILAIQAKKLSTDEIALMLNRKVASLELTEQGIDAKLGDLFAAETFVEEVRSSYAGINAGIKVDEVLLHPQHARLVYDAKAANAVTQHELDAMVYIKQRQVLYQQEADIAAAPVLGDQVNQYPPISDRAVFEAISTGAGSGVISPANGVLGSLASITERIGQITNAVVTRRINEMYARVNSNLLKLSGDIESTVELSAIQNLIRNTPEHYVLSDDGLSLILRGQKRVDDLIASGKENVRSYVKIDDKAEDIINIDSPLVLNIIKDHIAVNGKRIHERRPIQATKNIIDNKDPDTLYFPNPDPVNFAHKAFVVDSTITGTGHMKMLHAASEIELDKLIASVDSDQWTVITKGAGERWKKAIGEFKLEETLNENYINAGLHKSGVSAAWNPKTDAETLINDLRDWHKYQETALVREAVGAKYSKQFEELKRLAENSGDIIDSSTGFASLSRQSAENADNPFMSYIRTSLNISNTAKIPARVFQNWLDHKVSVGWNTILNAYSKTHSIEELDTINGMWDKFGIKTGYYDAVTASLANHIADKGALSTFARRGNAILASLILRPDTLNAINNTIGSFVLSVPETQWLINAIKSGNADAVGDLAKLANITVPGTGEQLFSTTKLFHTAIKNFWGKNTPLKKEYLANGWTTRHLAEIETITDGLSIAESISSSSFNGIITNVYNKSMKFFEKAEKVSGNKVAEEFTRFVAADVMRQITDVAIKHGIINKAEAGTYINTFVNKVNGNYLASQRPMMFHGPVGTAVGLFQTYQVNFLQQMLTHISRGEAKNAGMILGMQGTIYGMNGLPAFQALNTQLIGALPGNENNEDIYSTLYRNTSKESADWFMYGMGSNLPGLIHPDLKSNLYVRGDINPRQITIVPTSIEDLPIISASTKFFTNIKTMYNRTVAGGNPWNVLLQGLEHNGVNRPLAGIGAILESFGNDESRSYSTSKSGALIATNELYSLVNLTRLLGAKPLDEAITSDFHFRAMVYQAKKSDDIRNLGSVLRTKLIGKQAISDEDFQDFNKAYVGLGGKQAGFNRFYMNVLSSVDNARANIVIKNLKSPTSQRMQALLDGGQIKDFNNFTSQ